MRPPLTTAFKVILELSLLAKNKNAYWNSLGIMKTKISLGAIVILIVIQVNLSCKKETSCEGCKENNKPPIAIAGPDQVITLPTDSVFLDGSSSSDPDGTISEWRWKKISGPASFLITNSSSSTSRIKNLVKGVYQFELKVTDNDGLYAKDTVQVIIDDLSQPNQPPVANAGTDQTIMLPTNSITVNGSGSSDPDNNITNYQWSKISGPSSFNIGNANVVQSLISNLVQGVYQFELRVTDAGGLFSKDTMMVTVTVLPPPPPSISCSNISRPEINAQLLPVGTLSLPRAGTNALAVGNKIFFAGSFLTYYGGPTTDYATRRVDIYDISTNTWSTAELSVARFGIAMVSAGNKVFFAGGENGDGAYNEVFSNVDIYDISTNTWTVASLSQPRSYIAASIVGSKVFFAGGEINDSQTSNRVDIYDLSTNTWSTHSLTQARAGIAATSINNKIYFAGGHITNYWTYEPSNVIDIYDENTNSWSTSVFNSLTGDVSGIAVADNIYWAINCKVEIRNINMGSSVDTLFSPGGWIINDGQNAVVKDNKLLFFRHFGAEINKFDIYDLITHTWSIGVLPLSNYEYFSAVSAGNSVYIFGGWVSATSISNQVWKLEF